MIKRSIPDVVFSARDIGLAVANGDDEQQRQVLLAWAQGVDDMNQLNGSWAMQCRAIVDGAAENNPGLSDAARKRIASMLEELVFWEWMFMADSPDNPFYVREYSTTVKGGVARCVIPAPGGKVCVEDAEFLAAWMGQIQRRLKRDIDEAKNSEPASATTEPETVG